MKKLKTYKITIFLTVAAILAVYIFLSVLEKRTTVSDLVFAGLFALVVIVIFLLFDQWNHDNSRAIEERLSSNTRGALETGEVGVLLYNEDYVITYLSSLFKKRHLDRVGDKLLQWLPELQELISGSSEQAIVVINDEKYRVSKSGADSSTLFFKDISHEYNLEKKLKDNSAVLGFVSFDNYDESIMSEDDINYFNTNIKALLIEYFRNYGIVFRTTRSNQIQLVLNRSQFEQLRNDHFSVLRSVRREAKSGNLDITISMSFALGSEDLVELDSIALELLELAQTRGGDQVVTREVGKEAVFYGGSSEAKEKQSKIKVRVTANTLRHLILESSNVIICGHRDADADCVGSALCVSLIARILGKQSYVILKSGGVDPMIQEVVNSYNSELVPKHTFVSEDEAMDFYNRDSLVVMVDHHDPAQSNGQNLLKTAEKIVIIDHHRRKADIDVEAMLMYVEAGSSSATELCFEFLPYISRRIPLSAYEANIMFLGIMIDTNRFRVRTGARTFDVCRLLRQYGADPGICDELAQEPFERFMQRTRIMTEAVQYRPGVIVAELESGDFSRSIVSQACDSLIQTRGVEAGFVIANCGEYVIVSARSKGRVNVQVILEKMNGGGHMTAAGLQRMNSSVADVAAELREHIDEYFTEKERVENESNITE